MQLTFPKLALLAHLSIASGKTLRAGGAADDNIASERDPQSMECNEVFKTLTSDVIRATLTGLSTDQGHS